MPFNIIGQMCQCLFTLIITILIVVRPADSISDPRDEFYQHQVIDSWIFDEASSKTMTFGNKLTVTFKGYGKTFILKLFKNSDLLPEHYFEKYVSARKTVTHKPVKKLGEHCHYQGYIDGISLSWAAISTCAGLSGIIFDGEDVYYIHPNHYSQNSSSHFIFKETHRKKSNLNCGSQRFNFTDLNPVENGQNHLHRRSVNAQPFKNSRAQYVELILVMDYYQFRNMGFNKDFAVQQIVQVANILYGLFRALNVFISLVGVEIWSEKDTIVTTSAEETLTNFLNYRATVLSPVHPNDNAQLLTGIKFSGDVVGKALKGTMCTSDNSGGVNMFHSNLSAIVAATVAHEMGHNFGIDHDSPHCYCTDGRCIMASSSSSTPALYWSNCSKKQLQQAFNQGLNFCLQNIPYKVQGPICGNGYVEKGEECDCGPQQFCNTPCCNATTCQLVPNATCATGSCCDVTICQVKKMSTLCRAASGFCDLPEYCDGVSKFCPTDVYVEDGTECDNKKAYCYAGQCRSHLDQCYLLWGQSSSNGPQECYNENKKANRVGDCGYNFLNKTHKPCNAEDIYCGRLHCVSRSSRLKFGSNSSLTTNLIIGRVHCHEAFIDMGLNVDDQGLVPNGAKCGKQKVCFNQKCIPVSKMRKNCHYDCGIYGICNSNRNCHCNIGLAPPYCSSPGVGGSVDSGPPSDPYAYYELMVVLFVIFLGIIPFSVIITCTIYYSQGYLKTWWTSKARQITIRSQRSHVVQHKNDKKNSSGTTLRSKAPMISNPLPVSNKQIGNNITSSAATSLTGTSTSFNPCTSSVKESPFPAVPLTSLDCDTAMPIPIRQAPPVPVPTPARPAPPPPGVSDSTFSELSSPIPYSWETRVQYSPKPFSPFHPTAKDSNIPFHQSNCEKKPLSPFTSTKTGVAQQYLAHLSTKPSGKLPHEIQPSLFDKNTKLPPDDSDMVSQKYSNTVVPASSGVHKCTPNTAHEHVDVLPSKNSSTSSIPKTPIVHCSSNVASLAKIFQQNSGNA